VVQALKSCQRQQQLFFKFHG